MPNVFTSSMDVTKPAGTRSKLLGDDDIREFKVQFCERFNIDHEQPQTEAGDDNVGFHKKATLLKQGSDPTTLADALILYSKVAGSYSELHTVHENAGIIQLTRLGKLLISSLGIASEADGDVITRISGAWGRLALGSALQVLRVNAGATALEYATEAIAATQADQEAASSVAAFVTPGRQQSHPSACKAWAVFAGATAGTHAVTAGYAITNVTRISTGRYTITLDTAMSSANYHAIVTGGSNALQVANGCAGNFATGSFEAYFVDSSGNLIDPSIVSVSVFGDQ